MYTHKHVSFKAEFFTNNRNRLQESVSGGVIVIPGNGQSQRSGDTAFPFRQDSNFWYLTGINEPDMLLVISENEEFIILPKRTAIQEVFDGSYSVDEMKKGSGIQSVHSNEDGWQKLTGLASKHKVFTPTIEEQNLSHDIALNYTKAKTLAKVIDIVGKDSVKDVSKSLMRLRILKQKPEIAAIQKSIDITISTFKSIFKKGWYKEYKNESDINAELLFGFAKKQAESAYLPIVASGENACTLHYIKNNQPIQEDKPLLIDAGAEVSLYAADITRVYSPKGFSKEQQAIYGAVNEVNKLAQDMVRPGETLKNIELAVEKKLGDFLYTQKYITSKERKVIRKYYPHSVSHHLGLDVHDVADYEKPLEEGMVITIEPGLYLPKIGVGIRIEDDILVTKDGSKNLSSALPS